VRKDLAIPHVERLVVDEQTNDLSVRDVDEGLARFGIAEPGFGVRQRPELVEGVQVRPGHRVWLSFVEVRTQADVAVREREHGFGLREDVEVEMRFAQRPWRARERSVRDHLCSIS
jgi:hypothetical protein